MSDEHRLIAQLRTGDRASHEYVVRAYGGSMLATSRRLVQDEEDARDCVQDAFLQAFRNIHDFEGRSALGTWLHRIVINAALAKIRVRDRRREISMGCRECRAELEAYRRTIALGRAIFAEPDAPVGGDVPEDLVKAVLAALDEHP